MTLVDTAFDRLRQNLEITTTEQNLASTRHARIRDHVRNEWTLDNDFLTGSYVRNTKTKRLKDVDIFVVVDPGGPQGRLRSEPPSVVLNALLDVIQLKWPNAFLDGMAVVVPFGSDEEITSMEVVPAFDRAAGGYLIPNPDNGNWLATNPKTHHEMSSDKNANCDRKYVPFVKMVKAANRELGEPVAPSFLLEVIAMDLVQTPFGSYQDELITFFATAADQIGDKFDDPAGLGGNVNNRMTSAQVEYARRSLREAQRIAEGAVDLEDEGSERAAITEWKRLFGNRMPSL